MDQLPEEVLLMIFEWLPPHQLCVGASLVCRRWARVSRTLALYIRHVSHVKFLRYRPRIILVGVNLPDMFNFCNSLVLLTSRLQELSIQADMPLSPGEFNILARLPHLRHLDVFSVTRYVDKTVLLVARRLRSLVINDTVEPGFLCELADSPHLCALNMYGRSFYYPGRDLMVFLKASVGRLSELTLRCNEVTDRLYGVISTCVNLKTLQLYSCWMMTKTGAMYLMQLKNLRCLHITGARMVRKSALALMISELPQSIYELALSASWFSDEHVAILSERLPRLEVLELWRCYASADGLATLASSLQLLRQLDTDMTLETQIKQLLLMHPTLERVRCKIDAECTNNGKLKFLPVCVRYKYSVIRGDGEGYRADLFYYWNQRIPLENIPQSIVTGSAI